MLRHDHIQADPAMLSTRENGAATLDYPLIYEYNYLICVAQTGGKMISLDASQPYNAYAELPAYCYNWAARAINEKFSFLVDLSPDSVTENRTTNVMFFNGDKGDFEGAVTTTFGMNESFRIRDEVKRTSQKDYLKSLKNANEDMVISNEGFDSLEKPDHRLIMHFDVDPKGFDSKDIIYFNPVLTPSFENNPFTDAERLYPVEMPAKIDYTYLLTMDIPKGFRVDEMPKSARVNFNENQGSFEYLIQQNPENIQMRVHIKFNQAMFPKDEYPTLRDFFAYVVKKESEQIVFKKIK